MSELKKWFNPFCWFRSAIDKFESHLWKSVNRRIAETTYCNDDQLKPCHHCESEKLEVMQVFSNSFVQCNHCGARGPIAENMELAVKCWNARGNYGELLSTRINEKTI